MESALATRLDALRPVLKQHWAARLRRTPAAPPGAGLVTPEMLVLMVDSTLNQLITGPRVSDHAKAGSSSAVRFNSPRAGCQCGLHLLLAYYSAGAWALREVLPPDLGTARRRVVRRLAHLARHELTALCGVCRHRGGSFCRLHIRSC